MPSRERKIAGCGRTLNLGRRASLWAASSAVLALLFLACEDGRLAGTSTSVGTSIGGQALTAGGEPAAGARVTVRTAELAYKGGRPEGHAVDSARADAAGRFAVSVPADGFFLEIEAAPGTSGNPSETYFTRYVAAPESLKTARLSVPGAIRGRVALSALEPGRGDSLWVGIEGSSRYALAVPDTGVSGADWRVFRIEGLYPGSYPLHWLAGEVRQDSLARKAGTVRVRPGEVTEIRLGN